MMIPKQNIGVIGDRGGYGEPRIEFRYALAGGSWNPVLLGDGNFAQVFDGQLRFGQITFPLAIKVQRSNALNREAFTAVEAKFDAEKATHTRLRKDRTNKEDYPIVELVDWRTSSENTPIKLAPSILCSNAKHSLRPQCPQCSVELMEDPWTTEQNERAIVCPNCSTRFGENEENKSRILGATVFKSASCEGCTKTHSECAQLAHFFNFFPARVLLFERQEIDLDNYLSQSALPREQRAPADFWERRNTSEHPLYDIGERLDILWQILKSLAHLHKRSVATASAHRWAIHAGCAAASV